jgi:hypothetical protein
MNFSGFGKVCAIYCAMDQLSRPIYLCDHPVVGLSWAHLGTDLDSPASWRGWAMDAAFDVTTATGRYLYCLRLLLHELRAGRYSFAQFVDDLEKRSAARKLFETMQVQSQQ